MINEALSWRCTEEFELFGMLLSFEFDRIRLFFTSLFFLTQSFILKKIYFREQRGINELIDEAW